jgi:hypothetical protein
MALGKTYDPESPQAKLGDGFKDYVLEYIQNTGHKAVDLRSELIRCGYSSTDVNKMEQQQGDIFLPEFHLYLECKTSDTKKDSVCVKPYQRMCFSGPNKFYVTSYFDGEEFTDLRVHHSEKVKEKMVILKEFCILRTRESSLTLAQLIKNLEMVAR